MSDIIEGRNPVIEALKADREIEKVLIAKGADSGSVKKIIAMTKEKGIPIQYVEKPLLDKQSETNAHQGVMAYISAYKYSELEDIVFKAQGKKEDLFVIILEGIEDPYNLGAIIRSAEAAGAHGIIIPKRRAVGLTASAVKASAGAVEYMPVVRVSNIVQTVQKLKELGVWIAAAHMDGEEYNKANLTGKIALVIGSEGKGISKLLLENCDFAIKMPMKGKIESLNASAAAAVMMYEVVRQRSAERV
ncbi:MAG: 23S rRNA (guanosine(2251)-2'-O)-methyltransferase RlmB [Clostridiales bacterium]|nr:23S rRNA (guanosine(2251)-2'-O)-methyltransferase RlmB [Clostridiales bacterium]